MIIRGYIVKLLARPIFLPVLVVTYGFWYGTYKVTSSTLQAIFVIDKANLRPSTRYASYITSFSVGGAVVYLGRSALSSLTFSDGLEKSAGTKGMGAVKNMVKSVIPGKRGIFTLFASSVLAATAAVSVQKYG